MENRERIEYLDNLRFTAMLLILCVHITGVMASSVTEFGTADWELVNIFRNIGYSGPALFFMISGFLILNSEKTADVRLLLTKRLPRLVIPLIAWTAVASAWLGHLADDYSLTGLLNRWVQGLYEPAMTHFWFMFSLIAIYCLSPLLAVGLKGLDSRGRMMLFVLIGILNLRAVLNCFLPESISRYLNFDLLNKLLFLDGALGCFLLGYWLGNMKKRISDLLLSFLLLLLLAAVSLGSRMFRMQTGSAESPYANPTLGLEVGIAACIFLLFKQNAGKRWKILEVLPALPLTYPIYYLHIITMELIFGLGWTPKRFIGAPAFILINFCVCYLLTKTATSIRPICYLSSGLRFSEACESCNWQYTLRKKKL